MLTHNREGDEADDIVEKEPRDSEVLVNMVVRFGETH